MEPRLYTLLECRAATLSRRETVEIWRGAPNWSTDLSC